MAEKAGGLPTIAGIQVEYIENRTFDEIEIGESASLERTLTEQDITLFAVMSGDINPAHVDPEYEEQPFSGGDRSRHVERCDRAGRGGSGCTAEETPSSDSPPPGADRPIR